MRALTHESGRLLGAAMRDTVMTVDCNGDPLQKDDESQAVKRAPDSATLRLAAEALSISKETVETGRVRVATRTREGWDRDRARPAVGEGFPLLLFRLQAGSQSHHGVRFSTPP